jgi:hypothetical protein
MDKTVCFSEMCEDMVQKSVDLAHDLEGGMVPYTQSPGSCVVRVGVMGGETMSTIAQVRTRIPKENERGSQWVED